MLLTERRHIDLLRTASMLCPAGDRWGLARSTPFSPPPLSSPPSVVARPAWA